MFRSLIAASVTLLFSSIALGQTPISYGQAIATTLPTGAVHSYQFQGIAGEKILVMAARTTTNNQLFSPCVEVRDPNGGLVDGRCSQSVAHEFFVTLATSGPHRIDITDEPSAVVSGQYTLALERVLPTPSANAASLAFGQTRNTTISPAGEYDCYTFLAKAGVPLRITASRTTTNNQLFSPCVRLLDPTGKNASVACSQSVTNVANHTTTQAGRYVVLIRDETGAVVPGSYSVSLQCLAASCEGSADYTVFGTGCIGSAGTPTLAPAAGSLPILGSTFTLEVTNLPPSPISVPVMFTGASNTVWGTSNLPLDLTSIGMAGCFMLVSPDFATPMANVGGTAQWIANVPLDQSLVGGAFYNQCFVFDPASGTNLGFTTSNGGCGVMG